MGEHPVRPFPETVHHGIVARTPIRQLAAESPYRLRGKAAGLIRESEGPQTATINLL